MKKVTGKSFYPWRSLSSMLQAEKPRNTQRKSVSAFFHPNFIHKTNWREERETHWMKNQSLEIFSSVTKSVSHPSGNRIREPGSIKIPDSGRSFHPWHRLRKEWKGRRIPQHKSPIGWSKIAQVGTRYEWFCHFSLPENLQESAVTDLFTKLFTLPFFLFPLTQAQSQVKDNFMGFFVKRVQNMLL